MKDAPINLPELPEGYKGNDFGSHDRVFSDPEMRTYARAALKGTS